MRSKLQPAIPGPESHFTFGSGFSASPECVPEGSAAFAEETREPAPAVSIGGQHRTGPREKRRLPGLTVGLDRQHVFGHVSLSDVGPAGHKGTEHKVTDGSCIGHKQMEPKPEEKLLLRWRKTRPQPPKSTSAPISIGVIQQW